jgi:sporulation protein YlmC with PRC-barrel domain
MMMEKNSVNTRLLELEGSGYEIVDEQPNILGWSIRDTEGRKLGVVSDLLFDPEVRKVRYIVANLRDNDFDLEKRKVLIPIGVAQIHQKEDDVILPSVSTWQIRALPTWRSKQFTEQEERETFNIFSLPAAGTVTATNRTDLYEHAYYNDTNLYRNRPVSNQPIERSFRLRTDADSNNRYTHRYDEPDTANEQARTQSTANYNNMIQMEERIMERLKRMELELSEVKKDMRNLHEESGNYLANIR